MLAGVILYRGTRHRTGTGQPSLVSAVVPLATFSVKDHLKPLARGAINVKEVPLSARPDRAGPGSVDQVNEGRRLESATPARPSGSQPSSSSSSHPSSGGSSSTTPPLLVGQYGGTVEGAPVTGLWRGERSLAASPQLQQQRYVSPRSATLTPTHDTQSKYTF